MSDFVKALIACMALLMTVSVQAQTITVPAWLDGLEMSPTQVKQVSRMLYDEASAIRESIRAGRSAHEALEQLTIDGLLDGEEARAMLRAEIQTLLDIAYIRQQTVQRVMQCLTEDQRAVAPGRGRLADY